MDSLLRFARPASPVNSTGVSLRKLNANRLNAQRSTGPRTPDGKARVARNALTHGIFADSLLIEGEDPKLLEQHRRQLLADIKPQNYCERILAERIISASWRLERLQRAEGFAHDAMAQDARAELLHDEMPGELEMRRQHVPHRQREQHDAEIDRLRLEWAGSADCPPGVTLAIALQSRDGVFERYNRYEQRLDGIIQRAWRELRVLRAERQEVRQLPDTPYCSDPPPQPNPAAQLNPPAQPPETPVSERSEEPDLPPDRSSESSPSAPDPAPPPEMFDNVQQSDRALPNRDILQNKPTASAQLEDQPQIISTS